MTLSKVLILIYNYYNIMDLQNSLCRNINILLQNKMQYVASYCMIITIYTSSTHIVTATPASITLTGPGIITS